MREDDRNRLAEELAEKLLDSALSNYKGAEPRTGLEERVLSNLRQQSRNTRRVSWNLAPVMIAAAAVLTLVAADHLMRRQVAFVPASVAVSGGNAARDGVGADPAARQAKADEMEAVADGVTQAKVFAASKRIPSSSRRQDLALNLNSSRADERADGGFRIEEVRITEVRLDDIVLSNNERQE